MDFSNLDVMVALMKDRRLDERASHVLCCFVKQALAHPPVAQFTIKIKKYKNGEDVGDEHECLPVNPKILRTLVPYVNLKSQQRSRMQRARTGVATLPVVRTTTLASKVVVLLSS